MKHEESEPGHEVNGPEDGRCGSKKKGNRPGYCRNFAGAGTDHKGIGRCSDHGGSTTNHQKAAQAKLAKRAVDTYGLPREIDPATALLEEVYRTAGHVAWLGEQVKDLEAKKLIWGRSERAEVGASEFPGINTKRTAAPHVWLELYQKERKHLVDVCKAALAAGVAERQVRIAEQMGGQLANVIRGVLTRLGLDPGDPVVREALAAEFAVIAPAG